MICERPDCQHPAKVRRSWTAAEDALLRKLYADRPTADVAARIGRSVASTYQRAQTLGIHKSAAYFASEHSTRLRSGNVRGAGSRFVKGQPAFNKGLRRPAGWGPGRMKESQFKPGVRQGVAAQNWRPVGTIATDPEGYQRIKIRDAQPGEAYGFGNVRVWPLLQRHVWAQAHGPIPPGHNVCFRDGDRANCALDNLELVSRREMMRRNSVHRLPKELASAVQLLGALQRQINRRDMPHGKEKQD